jgi:hypothetical protein
LDWQTTDLVWSLWLGSLVLGYATILAVPAAGIVAGFRAIKATGEALSKLWLPILVGSVGGLFFLAFFSLHFCGFHAGHSVFLQQFFPLDGMPRDGFGAAFMNPPLLWILVFRHLIKPYGLFLIPALIAERKHVFAPLLRVLRSSDSGDQSKKAKKNIGGDIMGRPYINVVRMHLLIFFFAFAHFLKIQPFLVYTVVYAVYFFPWRATLDVLKKK